MASTAPSDGIVGAVFPAFNSFVTSPNQLIVRHPLLGERNVRMRRLWHFALDDPIYHPQPFNNRIGHLAVICYGGAREMQGEVCWHPVSETDFDSIDTAGTATGLGRINIELADLLSGYFTYLRKRFRIARASPDNPKLYRDIYLRTYEENLKLLVRRLSVIATYTEAAMTVCLTQRGLLEFEARLDWLTTYRQHFRMDVPQHRPTAKVVGALTSDLTVADRLSRVCCLVLMEDLG